MRPSQSPSLASGLFQLMAALGFNGQFSSAGITHPKVAATAAPNQFKEKKIIAGATVSGYFLKVPGSRGAPSHQVTLMEIWGEEGRALLALAGVGEALQRP